MRFFIGSLLIALFIVSVVLMLSGINLYGVNTGAVLLALVTAYLVFSFGTIKTDEVAMIEIFGKPVSNLKPGLYFAPAGISKVYKETANLFQDELPADPEKIFRNDDKEKVPDGMFPPIRIKFGPVDSSDSDEEKKDPYNIPMVAEVVPVISWQIEDMMVFRRVFGTTDKVRQVMSDRAIRVCSEDFSKVTPAKALRNLNTTNATLETEFRKEIEKREGGGGIKLSEAYIKQIVFSHELNKAVTSVKEAEQQAKATVHTAEGAAKVTELAAEAERKRLVKTGLAKADEQGNITELVPDANTRVQTEAVKELAKVQGTLVLGNPNTMLGLKTGGDK
ncbi:MAG: SPFH domain-containing protein [Candidatus Paceibacterota bacterium]